MKVPKKFVIISTITTALNFFLQIVIVTSNSNLELSVKNDPKQVKKDKTTFYNSKGEFNFENAIRFRLWTRQNPILGQELIINNVESLKTSNFSPKRLTKIFIEGLNHRSDEEKMDRSTAEFRDAFIRFADINFIIVDWGLLASDWWYYTTSGDLVSKKTADFLLFLNKHTQARISAIHIIGFSWGAHIAGNAGKMLKGRLGRITGLDPAGPFFRFLGNDFRLDKSDARFIDVIHTNSGPLLGRSVGTQEAIGHVDFFANSSIQASKYRSMAYFIESISSPLSFPACETFNCTKSNNSSTAWENFNLASKRDDCNCEKILFMGEHVQQNARGVIFLKTKSLSPYGLGIEQRVMLSSVTNSPDYVETETKSRKTLRNMLMVYGTSYIPENYPNNQILIEALKQV